MTDRGFSNGSSKAALVPLMKTWAAEYGPAGVRVSAVSPGPTRTEGTAGMGEALDQLASAVPSGRGLPEEIAAAITYLASDAASFVQGAVLPVDAAGSRFGLRGRHADECTSIALTTTRWGRRARCGLGLPVGRTIILPWDNAADPVGGPGSRLLSG